MKKMQLPHAEDAKVAQKTQKKYQKAFFFSAYSAQPLRLLRPAV